MELNALLRTTIRLSITNWARACDIALRPYQREIARAVKDSVINRRGLTFVVILPRQSGKNELQAHLFAWLLFRYAHYGGNIVAVSPTFNPQTLNNMDRVRRSLDACVGSRGIWRSSQGRIYSLKNARLLFYSGETSAKVVGATADLLLSVDEAQDVSPDKFDKDFDPMTASTNATRIFFGTAWTASTLLERERRVALQAEKADGIKRVFHYTADDVCLQVPAYKLHLERKIAEQGRNHPHIRTQYFGETIEAQSGMFPPARLLSIIAPPISKDISPNSPLSISASPLSISAGNGEGSGEGPGVRSDSPLPLGEGPGVRSGLRSGLRSGVAFLLDVAGQDESKLAGTASSYNLGLGNPGRDSTTLTVVEIDLSMLAELRYPVYRVIARRTWTGESHLSVFTHLKNLAAEWHPHYFVVDATGVGEGLWGMLDRHFPARVIPVKFTLQEKSEIGWRFLNIIETGRFLDACHTDEVHLQYLNCVMEILPGPQKNLRWGVPDGARGPDGTLIHDDYILADSLVAKLNGLEWFISSPTLTVEVPDPLIEMDSNF